MRSSSPTTALWSSWSPSNDMRAFPNSPSRSPRLMSSARRNEMAFEQKDNSGSIFVNDNKTQDTHPDRSGSAKIDGMDYWVNGWLRKTKGGEPYLSLSFRRKDAATSSGGGKVRGDMDDAIPLRPEWRWWGV